MAINLHGALAIDDNDKPVMGGTSSVNNTSIINSAYDPVTRRLLVDSGGGGAGNVVFYTPTGTVNASNAVFGVTADPSSVISDGITYFEGHGFSYAAFQITLDIPPSQYIRYTL